jgi:membrane associated rhomboid family serine protease
MAVNGFLGEFNRTLNRYLTPAVKTIFLINVIVFLLLNILGSVSHDYLYLFTNLFAENPFFSVRHLFIWQFLTYMFIQIQIMHLVFNMLPLWFFAPALEERWGTAAFWKFYLTTGVGAGICHGVIALLTGIELGPMIGASGAIFGVLLANAAYFPDSIVIFLVFPMKMKHMVILLIVIIFMSTVSGNEGNVSNLTHLSGLAIAYLYLSLRYKDWDIRHWQWRR